MERSDFPVFYPIITRWMDNDIYGHVNNVTYYSYFDSVINRYLIEEGGLDIHNAPVVGFMVSSSCQFKKPVAYPDALEAGVRVARIGARSVTYEVGIFMENDAQAAAHGELVHVFVDRATQSSTPIPPGIREALERITV
ncbi:acyl-CoA thioesterase [Marinobacter sp. UBA2688]|uniref:acyl-CoA thioesterase n=1 Tax=Marinobacter sp. UBA2688 TaxID=1946816 RepID=UPI00257DAF60|nr:thioesterase family protein [Marinobacter sp. UBA2688]|tara:strand:- start:5845 stop:6261 length:417 start_codon:yes stop_codon:yes gene_type:complete